MLLLQSSHLISTATVPSHGPRDAGRRARLLAARRVRPRPRQAPLLQEEEDRGGSGGPIVTVHISITYLNISRRQTRRNKIRRYEENNYSNIYF